MAKGKDVLTTGDVAKICHVAPRTVSKWFDSGQLKGYRIPGSKDRRIPVDELIRFMKLHNMPMWSLGVGRMRILIVDSNSEEISRLGEYLENKGDYEVRSVKSNFETGLEAQKFAPHVMLVSLMSQEIDAIGICRTIRADEELQAVRIIAIVNGLNDSEKRALLDKGFDGYVSDTKNVEAVVSKIEEATAIIC
ncbi:MAG: helix-turn-helix domain-containing protein [Planctomycetota bacterium]|jgi:CheY-like chemotaxis protein